jgi:hypothetical protein
MRASRGASPKSSSERSVEQRQGERRDEQILWDNYVIGAVANQLFTSAQKILEMTSRTAFSMSAFVFKTLRWVITRRINKAQGGHGDAQLMNCVAKDPEACALPLGERRVGGKLGYVTLSNFSLKHLTQGV